MNKITQDFVVGYEHRFHVDLCEFYGTCLEDADVVYRDNWGFHKFLAGEWRIEQIEVDLDFVSEFTYENYQLRSKELGKYIKELQEKTIDVCGDLPSENEIRLRYYEKYNETFQRLKEENPFVFQPK